MKIKRILLVGLILIILVVLGLSRKDEELENTIELISDDGLFQMSQEFITEAKKVEKNQAINEQVKQQLVEQGYPEETVDDLLQQGAQKATELKNIAAVQENYGTPWNLLLYVGEYELVSLYIVGNTEAEKFVLGQYQDSTEERVIFVHMSTEVSDDVLKAGLCYTDEIQEDKYVTYKTEKGIVGIKFKVETMDTEATYIATCSGLFTQEDIDSFIGAIVDGKLKK